MANKERKFYGTGRRKSSSARVTLIPGKGNITVNGRDVHEYFPHEVLVMDLMQPLEVTDNKETFDDGPGAYTNQILDILKKILHYHKYFVPYNPPFLYLIIS